MSRKEDKASVERRKALKKILASTGAAGVVAAAPQKWTAPVVNSVVLPTHAQTSQLSLNYSDTVRSTRAPTNLLDSIIPSAHAGIFSAESLCINFNPDMTTYNAALQDEVQFNVVNGKVGIAEPILSANCDATESYTLKVLNGPSTNGVSWEIHQDFDVATSLVSEGVAQASDCIVDQSECED